MRSRRGAGGRAHRVERRPRCAGCCQRSPRRRQRAGAASAAADPSGVRGAVRRGRGARWTWALFCRALPAQGPSQRGPDPPRVPPTVWRRRRALEQAQRRHPRCRMSWPSTRRSARGGRPSTAPSPTLRPTHGVWRRTGTRRGGGAWCRRARSGRWPTSWGTRRWTKSGSGWQRRRRRRCSRRFARPWPKPGVGTAARKGRRAAGVGRRAGGRDRLVPQDGGAAEGGVEG